MAIESVYKRPIYKGYLEKKFIIEDTSRLSENYFIITNFPTMVGGGKYVFSLQGNPSTLRAASEVDIEILDVAGNPIYTEVTKFKDRFNNFYISFEIYDITAPGVATATVVGLASFDAAGNKLPISPREPFNVKWTGRFNVLPAERNSAELLFDTPPEVGVTQITIPTRVSVSVTQSAYNFLILTSSVTDNLTLTQPQSQIVQSSPTIRKTLDPRLQSIIVNTGQGSSTVNTVPPAVRNLISSTNGNTISYNDEYSIVVQSSTPLFSKELEGGIFSFYSSESLSGNNIVTNPFYSTRSLATILTSSLSDYEYNPTWVFAGSNVTYVQSSSVLTTANIDASRLPLYMRNPLYSKVGTQLKQSRLAYDHEGLYKQLMQYAAYIVEVPNNFTLRLSKPLRLAYYLNHDTFSIGPLPPAVGPTYLLNDEFELFNNTKQKLIASGGSLTYAPIYDARKDIPPSSVGKSFGNNPYYLPQPSYADIAAKSLYRVFNFQGFTGSIAYLPPPTSYATSSVVSSSYLEVTFGNLNPISGQVYRIKTSAKLGSVVGDYKLINDQIVQPVEYLTDAAFPNQTTRGRKFTDYKLIGYFESQSLLDAYWTFFQEHPNIVGVVTGSMWSSGSYARIPTAYTQSGVFTTQFNQNYPAKKAFTLSFKALLDPNVELEVYMNSDPVNLYTQIPQTYLRSFIKGKNTERSRYGGGSNRFGKFIGKIPNHGVASALTTNSDITEAPAPQEYQFDFETDASGLGRPLFRARVMGESASRSGSAYITDVSIKALLLNGFTPNILQYSTPLPAELVEASQLSQSIDFKLDYFDYTGKQSEYTTYLNDIVLNYQVEVPSNTCQDHKIYFYATTAFGSSSINTLPTND